MAVFYSAYNIRADFQSINCSLYPFEWTIPDPKRADPKTGLCKSPIPRFANGTYCKTLDPNYQANWKKTFTMIKPFIENGTIIGIFLSDEQMWAGATLDQLGNVTDMIKKDCPHCITFLNEAQDIAVCNFNKMNETWAEDGQCLPETLDWFGYDYYDYSYSFSNNSGWEVQRLGFNEQIYPRLSSHQKVVPTCVAFFTKKTISQQDADTYCTENAQRYLNWGLEDHRVVGIFPFYWPATQPEWWDLSQLPRCIKTWHGIGEIVVNTPPHKTHFPDGNCKPAATIRDYEFCDRNR